LYFNSEGIASLIVGHHLLTGKIVDLEKPFAVLQKKPITCSKDSGAVDLMDVDPAPKEEPDATAMHSTPSEYEVVAFIKQKVVFKDRPKPIVQKSGIRKQK
jgi:chromosome transmission fidelity protein 8